MSDAVPSGRLLCPRPGFARLGQRWLGLGLMCAASATAEPASPRFTHLSVSDGLSQSSVSHILQDRRGFLWFGTQEGLNRYDGYRFTVHRAKDQPGFLGDHDITALIADHVGDLWVGTSRGLFRHDLATGRFDREAAAAAPAGIRRLLESGDGRIFFATWDGGLWALDPRGRDRRARAIGSTILPSGTRISALAPGASSSIWAAGSGRLFHVEAAQPGGDARATEALRDLGAITVISADARGDVWIGREDADLLRYRPAHHHVDRWPQAPRNPLAILPATDGRLWIGARAGGLSRLDPTTGEIAVYRHDPDDPTSLSRNDVPAIYEDDVGSLWIGTWNGGINRLDPYAQAFRTLRHRPHDADSLPADDVVALGEAPDGRLWAVSRSGLVAAGDPRSGRFRTATRLSAPGRLTALEFSGPRVLVGASSGLVAIDMDSGRVAPLEAPLRDARLDARPINVVRNARASTFIAAGKEVFRATRDSRLRAGLSVQRLDPGTEGEVSALAASAAGGLWIGTEAGEVVFAAANDPAAPVEYRTIASSDGSIAAHGFVSALHEDTQGGLWVGTRRGLGRIEPKTGKTSWFGDAEGLPSTNVAGIAGDADGFLWLATNRGLTRLDPRSGAMTHFAEREGAQEKGYADGAWAAGGSGLLYFAGEGITVFHPRDVRSSPHGPRIAFTGLEILRRPVAPRWLDPDSPLERAIDSQAEVTLGPSATVFSVEMAPLDYADPPANRLAYRLEGFDPEWIETDARNRVATYTRLEPGRYVLRARARTKSGRWSEEAALAIHILAPWWRTRLALSGWSLLALLAVGLGWAAARRRARVRLALMERETLRRESLTDPLTGLYNRRFLATYMRLEVPKLLREYEAAGPAAESVPGLLLMLIDVDHFKSINDLHAHAAGDRILVTIAGVLRDHIRDSDLAVRWGGDEFLVVSRSLHREHAAGSVERLRAEVEALGRSLAAEGGPACTLSIGYAPFPFLVKEPGALTWEQTLDLADRALLLTKRRKRNAYTGLRARDGLTATALLEFLGAGSAAPLPADVEVLAPDLAE